MDSERERGYNVTCRIMGTRRQRRVAFTRLTLRVSSCSTMTETVFLQALRDSGCILSVDDNDAPAVFGTSDI